MSLIKYFFQRLVARVTDDKDMLRELSEERKAEKRERNQAGRPGKLHAKVAIIDDTALISSANLTDDAFNRNFEVGVLINNAEFLISTNTYLDALIADGTLSRLSGPV